MANKTAFIVGGHACVLVDSRALMFYTTTDAPDAPLKVEDFSYRSRGSDSAWQYIGQMDVLITKTEIQVNDVYFVNKMPPCAYRLMLIVCGHLKLQPYPKASFMEVEAAGAAQH